MSMADDVPPPRPVNRYDPSYRSGFSLRLFLAVLLVVYGGKQVFTALVFPPFTGHDEVAHWQFARVVATEGRLPTLHEDRLPGELYEFRRYALHWQELGQWSTFLYTAVHPPLYYAVLAPIFLATHQMPAVTQQYVLRCAAIPFGALTVLLAFRITRTIFPRDTFLAVTVPAVIAFQPQISYEAAMINNDIVAIALYTWLLSLLVRTLCHGISTRRAAAVGAVFGLSLLAKLSSGTALPLIVLTFWWSRGTAAWPPVLAKLAVAGAVTLAVIGPWLTFMYHTYGDFTGLAALSALQAPLGLTSDARFLHLLFSADFAVARWRETWGEFGWRLIPVSGWLLSGTAAVAMLGAAGLMSRALGGRRGERRDGDGPLGMRQVKALIILGLACVLGYLAVVQFGTQFLLTQARYYFPTAAGAALLTMFGLEAWVPRRTRALAAGVIVLALIVLNILIYALHVIPYWYASA